MNLFAIFLVRDIQLIYELSGLLILNFPLALSLAITLFSLAGIPPLAGFDAKFLVISGLGHSSAILAILASGLSAANYLRIIQVLN